MRWSRALIPTLKEVPAEAEIASHKLMLRAGMMRKLTSGIYTLLPLGWRVAKNVERIVREEMDASGAQELLLPALHPAELWQETRRWDVYGPELMRLKDRHNRFYALGPTHEEVITDLARREIRSYRQLPLNLYQIQIKFRDEIRPRFGVMRAREFIMKDAYSFDRDEAGLDESYRKMYDAYTKIFTRCGLTFKAVEADSGAIGGSDTHEFMAPADYGEAIILTCDSCGYTANVEKAVSKLDESAPEDSRTLPLEKVKTPGMRTVEEVAAFLGVEPRRLVKTLIYMADGRAVAALVRGDHELNEIKLRNALRCIKLEMASPEDIKTITGADVGFTGPVGLKGVEILADNAIRAMGNFVTGANEDGAHLVNVNVGRDFSVSSFADLRTAREGDICPFCSGALRASKGIEVGQIFKLGTKYSESLKATYLDEDGREHPIVMGCYGIGITRTVAACIEQGHDEDGIVWHRNIAPYSFIITPVNAADRAQMEYAERIYGEMLARGEEVLLDDRDERAGFKFKDADLIGIPIRITIGNLLPEGYVELKVRRTGEVVRVNRDDAYGKAKEILESL
ncbi:MAG: proline--tRNA ligase [bacterium]